MLERCPVKIEWGGPGLSDVVSAREEPSFQPTVEPETEFPLDRWHETISVLDAGSLDGVHDADFPRVKVRVASQRIPGAPVEPFEKLPLCDPSRNSLGLLARD